jgi:hypothetical protein
VVVDVIRVELEVGRGDELLDEEVVVWLLELGDGVELEVELDVELGVWLLELGDGVELEELEVDDWLLDVESTELELDAELDVELGVV